MKDDEFKQAIAASFIGAWLANNYRDACLNGNQRMLSHPPVSDAKFLAKQAVIEWNKWCNEST